MAEEESTEKEVVEKVDEGTDDYKKKLIIFIALIVVLLIAIIAGLIFLFSGGGSDDESNLLSKHEKEFSQSSQSKIIQLKNPIFFKTQLYSVNLKEGKHYLRMAVVLIFQDSQLELFLKSRTPIIDDIIISILKKENIENLRTRAGLELLKRDIYKSISHELTTDYVPTALIKDRSPIKDVLITGFVLN